jgi:hypothetical protein
LSDLSDSHDERISMIAGQPQAFPKIQKESFNQINQINQSSDNGPAFPECAVCPVDGRGASGLHSHAERGNEKSDQSY